MYKFTSLNNWQHREKGVRRAVGHGHRTRAVFRSMLVMVRCYFDDAGVSAFLADEATATAIGCLMK